MDREMIKMKEAEKKVSLIRKVLYMFTIFGIISIILSGLYTYISQTRSYHRECEENLKNITAYMRALIGNDEKDFAEQILFFEEHHDDLRISVDENGGYQEELAKFRKMLQEKYPNQTYGIDIKFSDLDFELQKAYAEYNLEYWRTIFQEAGESFEISYTYFIYPTEGTNIRYFIDPAMDIQTIDGKEYYKLGFSGNQDPDKFPMFWEAWETGKSPLGFDVIDNEYGYNYIYYKPVIVEGQKVGMVCADISVEAVNDAIISAVLIQMAGLVVVFILGMLFFNYLIKKHIVNRILSLEKNVACYAEEKDEKIADSIRKSEKGNDEIRSLSDSFAGMIVELKDYMTNLQKVTAEKERISAELNVATQIQEDMLPRTFPPFPDRKEFDLYATMDPAKEVGGDFYDFFFTDDDHIALVVADVSGKGVPAALFMVIAKTLIKNRALMGGGPAEILKDVNEQLCEGNEAELFVTVWLAVIQVSTGKGLAANAGHEHPALRRKGGDFELVEYRHSLALAAMEGVNFREHEIELHPGDTVFVYTDGVPEATNSDDELFGTDRMLESLNRDKDAEPEVMLKNLKSNIDGFVGTAPQFDDITMFAFRMNET